MRITCGKCDDCIHQGVCKIRDDNEVVGCAGDFMSVDEVVTALGKAQPVKPTVTQFDDVNEETGKPYKWNFHKCAVCGSLISTRINNYCANCGQAIDWEGDRQ